MKFEPQPLTRRWGRPCRRRAAESEYKYFCRQEVGGAFGRKREADDAASGVLPLCEMWREAKII